MKPTPNCQYTIYLSYVEDYKLQKALELLQVKNKGDLEDALRYMLMETVEEILTEKPEKNRTAKKHSAWRYLTPVVGGIYLLQDVAKTLNKVNENDK